ncbi:MAG TPA: metal ABC transporter permease [Pseudolabrys sp.]|jgi:zinc/manganese transport system permease protein|nr:metal ABC transporter permease [Pseudolabrys sp.]
MYNFLAAPFHDASVRNSFAAVVALALSAGPVGVFLMLRRMSLVGDAMSHAILPGVAIGFLAAGLNVFAMTLGGMIAGLVIALLAGAVSRSTELQEDASLAVFLLVSLALGIVIVVANGMDIERLMEFLFGEMAAKMNPEKLLVIAANSTVSVLVLALIYRPLVIDCVDPGFLRTVSGTGGTAHFAFLALLVLNLISGFHAFGTLLGVGIMIIPATVARFWTRDITMMIVLAVATGALSGVAGLLLAFHANVPSGPAVTLAAGLLYIGSVLFGRVGGVVWRLFPARHLEA